MAQHQKQREDGPTDRPDPSTACENYLNGKLPALTPGELRAIVENTIQRKLPTAEELRDALRERERALEKAESMITTNRADAGARALSATATIRTTLGLDELAVTGRDYREQQQRKGQRPRTPHLDTAIITALHDEPGASAREIWNALSRYNQDDLLIKVVGDVMEWDYCAEPQSCGSLQFNTFKSKLSRLRQRLPRG